jgi:NAD(P)-dependent dehydrogenase (short-subunit alcohol dehydrogenase family)
MKTYLITGGTSGVGKAIATGIAKTESKVVIVGRNASNAEKNSEGNLTKNRQQKHIVSHS